ncbi:MAG: hypothetical protein IJZ32_03225 [Clostridia bacterium]|nr:hypothetical protein [Clostridia bacterium]
MFEKEIYLKRKNDIKELLQSLNECPDEAFIQVEEFPSGTFTDKDGSTQALFKMYIDEIQIFISRRLKEWLVEKEVLIP